MDADVVVTFAEIFARWDGKERLRAACSADAITVALVAIRNHGVHTVDEGREFFDRYMRGRAE